MPSLSPVEKAERVEYVISRLKRGFSMFEVRKQFAVTHQCHPETARLWVKYACEQVTVAEELSDRVRDRAILREMFHDQIVAYQKEVVAVQMEINGLADIKARREEIISVLLPKARGKSASRLQLELDTLPIPGPVMVSQLLEAKSRIRERMQKVMNDLARLMGISASNSNWRQALYTLLDNNLISPEIGQQILSAIDEFEQNVRDLGGATAEAEVLDPDDFDQDWEN
jgi:hypothetical protein